MVMRLIVLFGALLFVFTAVGARGQSSVDQTQFPSSYVPSGDTMYKKYCSACHGVDGKGGGPVASLLKVPPPDLTTLAKRHGGKFPYEYVSSVLRFGPGVSAHGTADMPTWGPIFNFLDKYNERSVQQRIKNLTGYLASLQEWVIAGRPTHLFQTAAARPSLH
jgi:mono/diheme cytochrome c family protein